MAFLNLLIYWLGLKFLVSLSIIFSKDKGLIFTVQAAHLRFVEANHNGFDLKIKPTRIKGF
jgi:hypothetical protein